MQFACCVIAEVSLAEWIKAFNAMDTDGDGVLTRKEWHRHQQETDVFDAIPRQTLARVTKHEWLAVFFDLDKDGDNKLTFEEFAPVSCKL